ncbi:MAG TPA: TIGR02281 family clan AA aspartic protease [Roseiarcus sp.]|nr:TIGR02281 family clan AA aspartic protease [Roseiarcus sp.]
MLRTAIVFAMIACVVAICAPLALPVLLQGADRASALAPPLAAAAPSPAPMVVKTMAPTNQDERSVELVADGGGQYSAEATVNGSPVHMIVDTGATFVSLSADAASRIGVMVSEADYTARVRTANGIARAAPVTLVGVSVGEVYLPEVQALVLDRQAGPINLLGMSFLRRLSAVEQRQNMLILRQ